MSDSDNFPMSAQCSFRRHRTPHLSRPRSATPRIVRGALAAIEVVNGGDSGEEVSERKRALGGGGGQNSTLKIAVREQRRGKLASHIIC